MGWKDKAVGAFFVVAVLASLGTVGYIVKLSRDQHKARAALQASAAGSGDTALVRGIVLDYGRAIQKGDPDSACVMLDGDAFAKLDCRYGHTHVPADLAVPRGRTLSVRDVVVQGNQAVAVLRGGDVPQPVRLKREQRRWQIVSVGLSAP